jgi:hypothetical protein
MEHMHAITDYFTRSSVFDAPNNATNWKMKDAGGPVVAIRVGRGACCLVNHDRVSCGRGHDPARRTCSRARCRVREQERGVCVCEGGGWEEEFVC